MNDVSEFLLDHREALCFSTGVLVAVIVAILAKFFVNSVWPVVQTNLFAKWAIFASQFGFEVFLLQQWIHGYNAMYEASNPYNAYVLLPLIVTIPLFFMNILMGIGVLVWIKETS